MCVSTLSLRECLECAQIPHHYYAATHVTLRVHYPQKHSSSTQHCDTHHDLHIVADGVAETKQNTSCVDGVHSRSMNAYLLSTFHSCSNQTMQLVHHLTLIR